LSAHGGVGIQFGEDSSWRQKKERIANLCMSLKTAYNTDASFHQGGSSLGLGMTDWIGAWPS